MSDMTAIIALMIINPYCYTIRKLHKQKNKAKKKKQLDKKNNDKVDSTSGLPTMY